MRATKPSWQDIQTETRQERLTSLLQVIAPDVFSNDTRPCYIVDWEDCKSLPPANCGGFAGSELSLIAKSDLERMGIWKGEGHFIAIAAPKRVQGSLKYFAIGLHEAGHIICNHVEESKPTYRKMPSFAPAGGCDAEVGKRIFDYLLEDKVDCPIERAKWQGHDWRWIRAVCHLWQRCLDIELKIPFDDIQIAGHWYGLSDVKYYYSHLVCELESSTDMSFIEIDAIRPPERFCDLWRRDTGLDVK